MFQNYKNQITCTRRATFVKIHLVQLAFNLLQLVVFPFIFRFQEILHESQMRPTKIDREKAFSIAYLFSSLIILIANLCCSYIRKSKSISIRSSSEDL